MRKKVIYLLFMVVTAIMVTGKVNASTCPLEDRNALRTLASNVNVNYEEEVEHIIHNEDVDYEQYYLNLKIYNLNSKMRIEISNDITNSIEKFDYKDIGADGVLTLRSADVSVKIKYTIKIYGVSNDCYNQLLRTITVSLPKYNYFSNYEICNGVTEYYMCQKYINYEFDPNTFYNSVYNYKEKVAEQNNEIDINGDVKDNTSLTSKFLKNISDNKVFIIGLILIIGAGATVYVVLKKKGSKI